MKLLDSLGSVNAKHTIDIPNDSAIKIVLIFTLIFASFFLIKKLA